ncbi:UNVERIFIED_CONTAM: hypothetical protein GTU68_060748 [Idotea baltica]|nr:hypothetical protein [Idotea baltica]
MRRTDIPLQSNPAIWSLCPVRSAVAKTARPNLTSRNRLNWLLTT